MSILERPAALVVAVLRWLDRVDAAQDHAGVARLKAELT